MYSSTDFQITLVTKVYGPDTKAGKWRFADFRTRVRGTLLSLHFKVTTKKQIFNRSRFTRKSNYARFFEPSISRPVLLISNKCWRFSVKFITLYHTHTIHIIVVHRWSTRPTKYARFVLPVNLTRSYGSGRL